MLSILTALFAFSLPLSYRPLVNTPIYHTLQADLERNASFPGGIEALSAYIIQNIHYPVEARENKIQGRVFVSFVIDTDGFVTDVTNAVPSNFIGYGLEEEAIRVVQTMPAWTPGMQNGKLVKVRFTLPINFTLE